jgi:hypothetical protein
VECIEVREAFLDSPLVRTAQSGRWPRNKRRKTMQGNRKTMGMAMLVAALFTSLFFVDTARAQGAVPAFVEKFTLPYQVHWGKSVLQPGDYTIAIRSVGTPIIAIISNAEGHPVTQVMCGVRNDQTNGNALFVKEKDGQLTIHSLSLANLGMVLVYDPALAQKPVEEARANQTVPVISASK